MFICPDCCEESCENVSKRWINLVGPRSRGPCEKCGKTAVCIDCFAEPALKNVCSGNARRNARKR